MESPRNMKNVNFLLPGEEVLDRIRFTAYYRAGNMVLTDRRVLVSGHTGALGSQFTLLRGGMVAGFPLSEFESFVVGTGRRPALLLFALLFAVAGLMMFLAPIDLEPWSRLLGMASGFACLLFFVAWLTWPRTFATLAGKGLRFSGRVRLCEWAVFIERVQLAALAAKAGGGPEDVRAAVKSSGQPAEKVEPEEFSREFAPDKDWVCEAQAPEEAESAN